jgi:branched-chain amino acid transport system ATP-binding protein
MGNPRAVLLDEPVEGLAPVIVDGVARAILELKRAGLSVLLCEQNPRYARRLADRTCTIDKGQVRSES